ncbi:MAG: hypothetical protein EPO61_03020 [Nitrospirae bacterium]|nr:MAG: hypothetical protein EPO61_03020 [Nitrospirota bacterium]
MSHPSPVVILGAGYTGLVIHALGTALGLTVLAGSRSPHEHLTSIPRSQRLRFDLEQPQTWADIPEQARLVWCFPAVPETLVRDFAERVAPTVSRLVVLGSTSGYELAAPQKEGTAAPLIDEEAPLNLALPRVRGEEWLRTHSPAIVLRSAGIYGPGRHVLDWIRHGRVTASPRFVNLVHVEDLAGICLAALERGRAGAVYNVSDGQPRQWAEICRIAQQRWGVESLDKGPAGRTTTGPGKRLSIAKLQRDLGYAFRHPDLYEALDEIEAS